MFIAALRPLAGIFMAVAQPPKPGPSAALSSTNDLGNATQHDARVPSSAPGWLPVCPRGNFACARLAEHQQRTARAALHRAAVERRFGRSGPEVRVALPFHDGMGEFAISALLTQPVDVSYFGGPAHAMADGGPISRRAGPGGRGRTGTVVPDEFAWA
jgi:hypothetical protein